MVGMKLGLGAKTADRTYLDGQCLIAMPGMRDERFQRTVVYVCAHSDEGAMGLIINRSAPELQFDDLLVQLGIATDESAIRVNRGGLPAHVLRGGPVETGRGFVLHSADYYTADSTLPIDDGVCLTHTIDILKAIATGSGPRQAVLALGYAGWSAGQLENEIKANGWLHCPADHALLFDETVETKYQRALSKLGVDIGALSIAAGHA
jgi:putative transcriptional regulator